MWCGIAIQTHFRVSCEQSSKLPCVLHGVDGCIMMGAVAGAGHVGLLSVSNNQVCNTQVWQGNSCMCQLCLLQVQEASLQPFCSSWLFSASGAVHSIKVFAQWIGHSTSKKWTQIKMSAAMPWPVAGQVCCSWLNLFSTTGAGHSIKMSCKHQTASTLYVPFGIPFLHDAHALALCATVLCASTTWCTQPVNNNLKWPLHGNCIVAMHICVSASLSHGTFYSEQQASFNHHLG